MKAIILAVALMLVCGVALADNVFDDGTDLLKGRNEDITVNLGIAKTISLENTPVLGDLGADLYIKATTPTGGDFFKRAEIECVLEF